MDTSHDSGPILASNPISVTESEAETSVMPESVAPENNNAAMLTIANRSIWDGVYTVQQRQRGEKVYELACVRCHGESLEGTDSVPTLVGKDFLDRWNRKRVGNLFSYMKAEMPPKKKRTPHEYADVLAFLLSRNDAPVGEGELAPDFMELQSIRMNEKE